MQVNESCKNKLGNGEVATSDEKLAGNGTPVAPLAVCMPTLLPPTAPPPPVLLLLPEDGGESCMPATNLKKP